MSEKQRNPLSPTCLVVFCALNNSIDHCLLLINAAANWQCRWLVFTSGEKSFEAVLMYMREVIDEEPDMSAFQQPQQHHHNAHNAHNRPDRQGEMAEQVKQMVSLVVCMVCVVCGK